MTTALDTLTGPTMGTRFTARAAIPPGQRPVLLAALQAAVDRVDEQMSSWKPGSDLCRFNAAPAGEWVPIPPELSSVLRTGLAVSEASHGAFDMTLGRLVDLWGFGPRGQADLPPNPAALAAAHADIGHQHLHLRDDGTALRRTTVLQLDLSGIAKGFGVDEMARILLTAGIEDFLVEIDGELRISGRRPDGSPWRVAVALPVPRLMAAYAALSPGTAAIATSGDYRRRLSLAGRPFSHTIDARTGRPVENGPASVTVLDANCARADAIASALMAMPLEGGMDWAKHNGIRALWLLRADAQILSYSVGDIALADADHPAP